MGVARRTIRAALKELEAEGWFRKRGREGTLIAPQRRPRKQGAQRSVGFLFHNRNPQVKLERHPLVTQVRDHLEHLNIRLEIYRVNYLKDDRISASFSALMKRARHDLWLLSAHPPAIERWFHEKQIPAVVYGMGNEGTPLPTFSIDFEAIGRHAAGEFLRRGYRDVVLLLPRPTTPEDIGTQTGFESVITTQPREGVRYRVVWHDEEREGMTRVVDRLIRLARGEPMAWLISRPEFYLFIHTYLLHCGIRIPQQVGLICRSMTPYLPALFPEPARYVTNSHQLGYSFARYVLRTLEGHSPGSLRAMVEFTPGGTLL